MGWQSESVVNHDEGRKLKFTCFSFPLCLFEYLSCNYSPKVDYICSCLMLRENQQVAREAMDGGSNAGVLLWDSQLLRNHLYFDKRT